MSSFRNGIPLAAAIRYILGFIILCVGLSAGAAIPGIQALDPSVTDATISEVTSGSLDGKFTSPTAKAQASRGEVMWLRVPGPETSGAGANPIIVVHAGMLHQIHVYAARNREPHRTGGCHSRVCRCTRHCIPMANQRSATVNNASGSPGRSGLRLRRAQPRNVCSQCKYHITPGRHVCTHRASRCRVRRAPAINFHPQ